MPRMAGWILCGVLLAASGCAQYRMPTLTAASPAAQRGAYEMHDPFPDASGPLVGGRPPGTALPRAPQRRGLAANVTPPGLKSSNPTTENNAPRIGSQYSATVQE
jgi:hypothetical protein